MENIADKTDEIPAVLGEIKSENEPTRVSTTNALNKATELRLQNNVDWDTKDTEKEQAFLMPQLTELDESSVAHNEDTINLNKKNQLNQNEIAFG